MTDTKEYETWDLSAARRMGTEEEAELKLEGERIRKDLRVLHEAQREVIMLAYFGGLSQSEISNKLSQPLGTVKTRIRLAMQKLRVELEQDVTELP